MKNMMTTAIRNITSDDFPSILALNAESVGFLSPLDAARLQHLHAQATYHRGIAQQGRIVAFLLAFRENADYDSANYRWFAQRYTRFVYIDRVVVDRAQQGLGFGAALYDDILGFAANAGVTQLTCEFDIEPPNPASLKFHQRYGFHEVGTHWLGGNKKRVSLQVREIEA